MSPTPQSAGTSPSTNPGGALWPFGAPFVPGPFFQASWTITFEPTQDQPISAVLYDSTSQLLFVVFNNNFPSPYFPVPLSVMQTFSQSRSNPMLIFNGYVAPRYETIFLDETFNCPILNENGNYIWTN